MNRPKAEISVGGDPIVLIVQWFEYLEHLLQTLQAEVIKMSQDVTDLTTAVNNLTAAVATNTQEVGAATTEIANLVAQLGAAAGDPAAVEALVSQINTQVTAIQQSNQTLAAAIPASKKS